MIEKNTFKDRLSALKKKHGLTNKELAAIIDVTERNIGFYLNGDSRPDIDNLIKFARYFKCSTDYLLGYTPPEARYFQDNTLQSWYEELAFKDESEVTKIKFLCDYLDENFASK